MEAGPHFAGNGTGYRLQVVIPITDSLPVEER
jgi:hypothetical protein